MTSSAPRTSHHHNKAVSGFTLLELIISLTITTLVVLVIYTAFSMGVRVWERQGRISEEPRRAEVMLRLLDRDFAELTTYTTLWEGQSLSFFAGGPRTMFYVTRNGFGALRRQDKALFFTCLYVDADENDALGLYVYKVPEPGPELLREVRGFLAMNPTMRSMYTPAGFIQEKAVRIADGFSILEFSFTKDRFLPFAGPPDDVPRQQLLSATGSALDLEEWVESGLPGQIQLLIERDDDDEAAVLLLPGRGRV